MIPHFVIDGAFRVICMKMPTHVRIEGIDAATLMQGNIDFGEVRGCVPETEMRICVAFEWVPVIEGGRCWIVIMASKEAGWYP